ncbi:site-2 protease family protein [Pyrococcus furiosus DSM 3638]|uniref:Site-2 protease family protein n=2 Tax=Pyrococcus furiosus (strain ATCC 43587 / DSM 3638 / JCM 8422 / Vc1) TaxID=186497 RepID=A0A5C0XPK1_PYRFU|nr:metalloprotease [Pyrococcus furiosus DSM 3638]MDK2869276.1 hypothetical protein [Pyrococcus sp.]QEK78108.1 site-2 protease family protein [Pyrococcus furiosus DSM 3638]
MVREGRWRLLPRGIYECVNCKHREVLDKTQPLLPGRCPVCGGDMILVGYELDIEEEEKPSFEDFLREHYDLGELIEHRGEVYAYEVLGIKTENFEEVLREAEKFGYWLALKRREGKIVLYVFPAQLYEDKENPLVGIALFILTLLSTFFAGYILSLNYVKTLEDLNLPGIKNLYLNALAFSLGIISILGSHEMGHKIAATIHNVKSTFPYFIPFPSFIGTLGAIIRVKSPIPTRNAAIDLGASGPLVGLIVAIPVTAIGLRLSPLVPVDYLQGEGTIYFGMNLIFYGLSKLVIGDVPEGFGIILHPLAIAGWVGILVTFLNLLPAAQLDGGHIARAFLPEKVHRVLTYALGFVAIGLSYLWPGWFLWGLLILIMGRVGNPGALDEVTPLTWSRKVLAIIIWAVFIASATLVPFSTSS